MAVMKLSKNDIRKKNEDKIKLDKSQISYDSALVSDWETRNRDAYNALERYRSRISSGGYLSADDLAEYRKALDSYVETSTSLRGISKAFGQSADDDRKWANTISQMKSGYKDISDYFSQWKTEDAFKQAIAANKDYEAKLGLDIDAYAKEIEDLADFGDEALTINFWYNEYMAGREPADAHKLEVYNRFMNEYDGDFNAIKTVYSQMNARLNTAKRIQEGAKLAGVADSTSEYYDPEFQKYASMGGGVENPEFEDVNGWFSIGSWNPFGQDPKNKVTYTRENWDKYMSRAAGGLASSGSTKPEHYQMNELYTHMKEEEVDIYNYYLAKHGEEAADKYLDSITETLTARKAKQVFEIIEDNTLLELSFGVAAGFDQFGSGMEGLWDAITGNDEYKPPSSTQMVSGMVREDISDVGPKLPGWLGGGSLGQVGYDAVTTTSNMLPSILTSTAVNFIAPGAGSIVGTTLLGASAGGNAYQEMINLGYDKGQARSYAVLVGGSEAILQYALGGISKLGGGSEGIFQTVAGKLLPHIDNAFARTAIKLGGNMLDEGLEEGIQEILNPWFKNLVTHAGEDVNWSEVAYSSLLGALTAGVMEGGTTIHGEVNTYKTGKQLKAADISAVRLAELGQTFSADSVAYQLAGKVNENTGAYTIGRLFNEIGATLTEQNVNEITNALVEKGFDTATARKNAEALAYVVEGGQLTDSQIAVIDANETLAEVARTTLIDENTTWNQRAKGYNEALMALAQEKSGAKASRTNPAQQSEENASTTGTVDATNESGAESASEVDTSPAKVKNIADIRNGQVTIEMEDGSKVNVRDADLSPDDGVRIETIASIDGISSTDANFILKTLRENTGASAQMDSLGAKDAYRYGFYGFSKDLMTKHAVFANSLTEAQRNAIYEVGQKARQQQIDKAAPKTGSKQRGIYFDHGGGNVVAFKDANMKSLTEGKRKAGVQAALILNKLGIGGDIYFFGSYRNAKGEFVYKNSNGKEVKAPNGWYSEKDGSIHIDLNSGKSGNGLVLFTMAHELTHFIEQWSQQKYKILADFLIENYEKGQSVDQLVRAKQAKLSEMRGKKVEYPEAYSEVIADAMEAMLADGNVLEKLIELKAKDQSLFMKMKQFFDNLLTKIRNAYKGQTPDSDEGNAVMEMTDAIERIQQLFAEALVDASENFRRAETQKNTTQEGGDIRYCVRDGSLTTETTEEERYELLKDAEVILAEVNRKAIEDVDLEAYNTRKKSAVTPGFKALAKQLNILNVDLKSSKISFPFQFSGRNLEKSLHHQMEYGGTYQDYVKAMSCFTDIVKNAVPIEVHPEKKVGTARENPDLLQTYVLVSAYKDGKSVVPVQLEVKEFRQRGKSLYMTVMLTKIDLEVVDTGVPGETGNVPHLFSRSTISLRQLFENVNIKDGRFLKYVPDGFLNAEQKAAKQEALRRQQEEYTGYGLKKLSDRDSNDTYAEIEEERQKLFQRERELLDRKRAAESNPELLQAMDDYSVLFDEARTLFAKRHKGTATQAELNRIEEIKALKEERLNRVSELQESLGLSAMEQEMYEVRAEKEALRIAADEAWAREGAEKENKAIEKSGMSAPEYFRKKALKSFKTTTNFNEAGYLLPDGKLLDFSGGERNHRYRDHREIGEIYEATQGAAALNRFLSDGNIRIMAESPGIDIASSVEPTKEQYAAIKRFVNTNGVKDGRFFVDFSDAEGHMAGNYSYDGYVNVDRVINDIKYYFKNGSVREQSSVANFLWSDRDADSVSNRSLLANAFEGITKSSPEYELIQKYKSQISLIDVEEQKLSELNQKIKDLSFAKGPKDTKAIRDLQFKARQTANRINNLDKILLRLEASKPLHDVLTREKEKVRKREQQKSEEALEAYREIATKTQRELLEKWQESRKKGIDSRQRTAMRHKIKDIVNELNQYLLKGTKDRHVPIGLQKAVAEALNAVNMDTVGADERIAKLNDELLKAKTPEEIQKISKRIEHVREMGDRMDEKLKRLKAAYDEFIDSDDPLIANSHDDAVAAHMMRLLVRVGDTPLRDMTIDQLQDVYDVYKIVLATIRNANKSFKDNKNREISTRANQVMAEIDNLGVKRGKRPVFMDWVEKFGWDGLKPVYAMEHIGSKGLIDAYNNLRAGEDVWAKDIVEAREYYLNKFRKYKYDSWDFEKKAKFTSTTGKDFELTLDQIMSLYAFSKREQAADHLKYGGIVFDPKTEVVEKTKSGIKVKYNVANATAYNINEETLADIISKLTADQKAFVDEMQTYLADVMGAKGNEVSLAMYDVKLFKEKHYFPLKSAHQYMAKAKEQAQGDVKIKNSGFSKETKPRAKNPIVLSSFMDVWTSHVNEMSMYHAFVLPMEDFYRIYNYATPSKNENMPTEGVNAYIENAYGAATTGYIEQMLKDLNGGARTDSRTGFINKMMGLYKKGAVFASLSVVVQQPSAIARAAALVDIKHFIGPKVGHKRHKALWDEVKQYAPVAIIKEMGYFDTNMGKSTQDYIMGQEYSGFKEKMKALVTDSNYRDEILSKAPALADEIAWCSIWEAVKRETQAKHPGMDVKSEAFLKQAGERFTEVITKTQVYDSVLSRSAMMRSKDTGMKMVTAFMAEPTTSINMVADALLKGKRGDRKYCRAAIGSVIASVLINSILVSFVYAGRDDDEDESYAEKYIGTLTGEILDNLNPATYIPFIKDIISIVQGYDVERSDMSVVSDLVNAWRKLGSDNLSVYRKVEGFAGSIAQIFGLPVKNIMRDVRGIYQTVMSFVSGPKTTMAGIGHAIEGAVTGKDVSNQQRLYEACLSGDKTQIARVEGRYKDQSSITSAIRKALRENDPRILKAAQAIVNGNGIERANIAREIAAEGHFDLQDIQAAINAEIDNLRKESKGK